MTEYSVFYKISEFILGYLYSPFLAPRLDRVRLSAQLQVEVAFYFIFASNFAADEGTKPGIHDWLHEHATNLNVGHVVRVVGLSLVMTTVVLHTGMRGHQFCPSSLMAEVAGNLSPKRL